MYTDGFNNDSNADDIIIDDEINDTEVNDQKQGEKKKKKGLLYWIITILLILSVAVLLGVGGTALYRYYTLKNVTDNNAISATDKYSDVSCEKETKKVHSNYREGSLKEDSFPLNEQMGYIKAPTVDLDQAIYMGDQEDQNLASLDKGVAYDSLSDLPMNGRETVLAGHREFVFNPIQYLKEGDPIVVNIDGQVYTYKVRSTKIIGENDVNDVFLNDGKDTLVLYSCYPFLLLLPYTDRYVVYADPVESVEYPGC